MKATILVAAALAVAACQSREGSPGAAAPAAGARPTDAAREDWSLYSGMKNAQQELVVEPGAIAAAHTDWPLVTAQLMELRRSGDAVSVKLALRNGGVEMQKPMFILSDVYLVDPATGTRYGVLREDGRFLATTNDAQPDRFYDDVDPGGTLTAAMTFAAPPPGVEVVALEIPNVRPLERLTIQDQ
jgi:hypothetical protein